METWYFLPRGGAERKCEDLCACVYTGSAPSLQTTRGGYLPAAHSDAA